MNVQDVIDWEEGNMSPERERKFFQHMVNTGEVWKLQGMYGRRAQDLLDSGEIHYPKKKTYDYYGNPIPVEKRASKKKLKDVS